ncbi:cytochrome ubiquinol oxidase subunit II [Methylobacterium platani]|uniref:Ubiquinol oxidase subunit 2 n=1 Tax=Methylobacterium platani TaxID=427683 RepID=A0A179SBJ6_9HYPH|nr:cytochrome ubiquinol oxidase subunit II [Methylobacterium platani]
MRVLDPTGPVGMQERTILLNATIVMLVIIVPTMLATLAVAWWYRPGNPRAVRRPHWSFSGRIEIVTWSIPLLAILFLGGIAWIGSHDLDPGKPLPSKEKPLEVEVVSLDWKWLFLYPEARVASLNRLVIPVGRPVQLRLTSASVWNGFFVPGLGSMIYTMSGMATRLNLEADREGTFRGLSTHLSGDGFSDMTFETRAVPGNAFAAWLGGAQGSTDTLDDDAYRALSRQSSNDPPKTYRLADDRLFDRIVAQALPPGPGPVAGRPDPSVSPRQGH